MFDAVLTPHRSLTRAGFAVLIAVFVVLSLAVGLFFLSMGAWPVIGFYGLDVAALTVAFRLSYRSGRLRETLQLSAECPTVRRFAPSYSYSVTVLLVASSTIFINRFQASYVAE